MTSVTNVLLAIDIASISHDHMNYHNIIILMDNFSDVTSVIICY